MKKKFLITALALGVAMTSSSMPSEAQEPLYDQNGDLILDTEQSEYQDLSTPQTPESEVQELQPEQPKQKSLKSVEPPPDVILDKPETEIQKPKEEVKPETTLPGNVAEVKPPVTNPDPIEQGTLTPSSITYMAGSNAQVVTKGTLKISKVEIEYADGLPAGSWMIAGDTLSFDSKKLDKADSGNYTFKVTFEGGTETIFELKVLNTPPTEDYWQQNITSFSKDKRSTTYKDLELISSSPDLKVQSITIGGVSIPSSQYRILNGTVIISKSFLSQLDSSPRARVTVTYGSGKVVDFSLAITDDVEKGNTADIKGC
ncbi:hypothetical protein [Lysinibacillus xylanilyticus]|uniref:hypothetical protein n=1 Tax=Lysinibacillus xylanilyticus TaxID=582475 RepID=UPI0036DF4638